MEHRQLTLLWRRLMIVAASRIIMIANAQLRALLLHSLAGDEMETLSGRIVLEGGVAERLEEAEIDLIDDYANMRLTSEERTAVERYLLISPLNLERVLTARALVVLSKARLR
jgi:hypothetical protein